jgi:heat shock protein HtpX
MSSMRVSLMIAAMTALFMGIGYLLGAQQGMLIAFVVALGINIFAYWNSDKMVLRMYGARQVGPQDAPEFYGLVQQLAQRAELPMPKVYIMEKDVCCRFKYPNNCRSQSDVFKLRS